VTGPDFVNPYYLLISEIRLEKLDGRWQVVESRILTQS
jgi:hypothetical protein